MIKFNQPCDRNVWAAAEEKLKKKKIQRLHQQAPPLATNSSPSRDFHR
jgi:hypothetical protein